MHTVLASNLGLRDDQLQRVGIGCVGDRVVENADGLQQMSSNARLAGEVRGVGKNLSCLGLELHALAGIILLLHGGLDTHNLATVVEELVDIGVQHVGTTVDSGETSETLGQLSETVERVDVWRLSIPRYRVTVEPDALNGLVRLSLLRDVVVGGVQSHGVTNEIACGSLDNKLVVYILHGRVLDVDACVKCQLPSLDHVHRRVPTLVCCWVILLVCANPLEEVPHPTLLKETHERRSQCLASI